MNDLDILTRTLFGESERGDREDAYAIANVVMNRVSLPNWPSSAASVCLQPWQFSCWNHTADNAAHRARIVAADARDTWFRTCQDIARQALDGQLPDITRRSTHYYATYLPRPPRWARGKSPVFETPAGRYNHLFFNDIDTPPPSGPREALDQQRPLSESGTVRGGVAAAGGLTVAAAVEVVQQVTPAAGIFRDLAQAAPWLAAAALVVAAVAVGYMLWRRVDDRRQGAR